MNRDLRIAFVPADEGKLQIVLYGRGYPANGRNLKMREIFTLQVEEIDPPPSKFIELDPAMLGDLYDDEGKRKVNSATDLISNWLLNPDFSGILDTIIGDLQDNAQVRLIFSADKRLRNTFDLTKVPVELMRPEGVDIPFAINPKVAAILHLLDEVGSGQIPASSLDWPLRILIVRSNPKDLGLAVPDAVPVRDKILKLGEKYGPGAVVIDVISSEPAVGKAATWDNFTEQLHKSQDPYDIVIYLGHGSLKEEAGESVGCLQLEEGAGHKDIPAYDIVVPFQNKSVPIVLLIACQTADQVEDKYKSLHKEKMSYWLRGSQGVAQALINSLQSGTQLVVGMRYRLDTADALRFLDSFFESLLKHAPGNIEAAVHMARRELKTKSRFPAAFSAPVIFRRLRAPEPEARPDEPLLPFIAEKKYIPTTCQGPVGDWKARYILLDDLKELPWGSRSAESKERAWNVLKKFEERLIQNAVEIAPLILPDTIVSLPGDTHTLAVKLWGTLSTDRMEKLSGQILFDREDIVIQPPQPSPELEANGYTLLTGVKERVVTFSIEPKENAQGLQNLTLMNIPLQMGQSFNVWFTVSISGIQTEPQKIICPGVGVVIIPPP